MSLPPPFDEAWRQAVLSGLDDDGARLLARAADWVAPRLTGSAPTGEPLIHHAAGAARLLADLHADAVTRAAALLVATQPIHDAAAEEAPAAGGKRDTVEEAFGAEVARLVRGARALLRLGMVARHASDSAARTGGQKEMQRKMLLAMAADLRIVLMRLASRLQTLRWHAESRTPCDPSFARETLDIYTPLANRLGIWQIKWEMEDLAFRFLETERYKQIAGQLEEKRAEREGFIADVVAQLRARLTLAHIDAEVSGRPKHIYSIWNKMRDKRVAFSQLYDLRALRVIVPDVRACYTVLALVHEMWEPIAEEFDDYISRPKPNGYRSLHTAVRDAQGRSFEVQIRTRDMHQFAEYGMAAHWHYKESGSRGGQTVAASDYDRQLSWMRQLLAWNADLEARDGAAESALEGAQPPGARGGAAQGAARDTAGDTSHDTARDTSRDIYVLTPQARVIELPEGATPIDFAYHLHTDLGHRCRGARVDGQMAPLNTRLQTGQTVEVVTAKSGGPSRDWLRQGWLVSPRARSKVRAWFNAIELQQRITQGQALVEKELQRLGKTAVNQAQLAQTLGYAQAEDLYVAVAKEEFSLRHIDAAFQQPAPAVDDEALPGLRHAKSSADSVAATGKSGVLVVGVGSLLTQLARCCRPAPPDAIRGFVTRGRGVSIHREDCHAFQALAAREAERVIDVAWGNTADTVYPVDVTVHAHDRSGLLRDLSEVFARLRLNVIGVNTQSRQSLARMVFTVEVRDGAALRQALDALGAVAGVTAAQRR